MVAQPRRELSHTLCRRSSRTPSPVCSRDTFSTVSAALLSSCHTQAFLSSSATSFTRGATRSTTTSTPRKVTLLWVRSTKDLFPSTQDSVVQHPFSFVAYAQNLAHQNILSGWSIHRAACRRCAYPGRTRRQGIAAALVDDYCAAAQALFRSPSQELVCHRGSGEAQLGLKS